MKSVSAMLCFSLLMMSNVAHADALENTEVQTVMQQSLSPIRHCYEDLLGERRLAQGKIRVNFKIDLHGKATDIKALEDTLGDERMAQCVFYSVLKLQFPKPRGNDGVSVTYPFVFRPR